MFGHQYGQQNNEQELSSYVEPFEEVAKLFCELSNSKFNKQMLFAFKIRVFSATLDERTYEVDSFKALRFIKTLVNDPNSVEVIYEVNNTSIKEDSDHVYLHRDGMMSKQAVGYSLSTHQSDFVIKIPLKSIDPQKIKELGEETIANLPAYLLKYSGTFLTIPNLEELHQIYPELEAWMQSHILSHPAKFLKWLHAIYELEDSFLLKLFQNRKQDLIDFILKKPQLFLLYDHRLNSTRLNPHAIEFFLKALPVDKQALYHAIALHYKNKVLLQDINDLKPILKSFKDHEQILIMICLNQPNLLTTKGSAMESFLEMLPMGKQALEEYILKNKDLFFNRWNMIETISMLYPQSKTLREAIAQYILDHEELGNNPKDAVHLYNFLNRSPELDAEIEKDAIAEEQKKFSNR